MEECSKNCSYYIGKDRLHLYRHKFIWVISITTVLVVILFFSFARFFNKSFDKITCSHNDFVQSLCETVENTVIQKDSLNVFEDCIYAGIEEQMYTTQHLLELQSVKIQSDFSLLSLWAGVLMVVFLVFSIYSMFKTDELIKQGREGLLSVQETQHKANTYIEIVDTKVNEELKKVSEASKSEISKLISESANATSSFEQNAKEKSEEFSKIVKTKTEDFNNIYDKYVSKIDQAEKSTHTLISGLISVLKDGQVEQKDGTDNTASVSKEGESDE